MEKNSISVLENFALLTHIMPYYETTHRVFLMLSKLCTGSRRKLKEFYYEFIYAMSEYWSVISIRNEDHGKRLFLPSQLFIFDIKIISEAFLESFIEMVTNLEGRKGFYFQKYYMHKYIMIKDHTIQIKKDYVINLFPYIETMKRIRLMKCSLKKQSSWEDSILTLFDTS